ncbi:signal peptidase I [Butyrivibrio sp. YAB3001]|uniref:signal peptidase I n=1 Tax=Butyrivibrio sp. YAB3001 TaxID=1520812 RepID=UPI0008F683F0|nr:signal peptidase I [Butyrivibrio sp. YAB3001]SFB68660.1 signal peptidase I [Butyrivibrio sp. YAB3001]
MFRKKSKLTFHQKKTIFTPKLFREIFSWISVTVLSIVLAFVFVFAFGMQVKVIGDSMEPSAYNGQTVLVNKLIFKIFGPSNGDIVVFLPNGNTNSHFYVKRVVAVPGDKVQIIDGSLYINGTIQDKDDEEYDKMEDAGIAANEIKLKSGEYFVLGDNRNSSEDSRSANIGIVKTSMMVGKVWYKMGIGDHKGGIVLN